MDDEIIRLPIKFKSPPSEDGPMLEVLKYDRQCNHRCMTGKFNLIAKTGRKCGDCTFCCKVLPISGINKPFNTRCQHQRRTGCRIYDNRPIDCRAFSCMWLEGEDAESLRRPDRGRYCIPVMPDYIEIRNNDTGETTTVPALEVWLDPVHPNAHRDEGLRAYLERRADENGMAAIVRLSPHAGFVLMAPSMMKDGKWAEVYGQQVAEHDPGEIVKRLGMLADRMDENGEPFA